MIESNSPSAVERCLAELQERGYCLVPDALPAARLHALGADLASHFDQVPFCEGGFYGATTKRLGRLLVRSDHVAALVLHPLILEVAERLLAPWCERIQLNVAQAIALHPGAPAQLPHRDQDMWCGDMGRREYLINVMWPLSAFSADNGATRIWPGSHGVRSLDAEPPSDPVAVEMTPGAALLFLGSTLHGAGANRTAAVRRGVVVGYSLGWLKPYENPWLSYPPAVARHFPAELAALVGYRQHRPNLGNYEGQCPSVLLRGDPQVPLGAVDALRPDQEAQVAAFVADQSCLP